MIATSKFFARYWVQLVVIVVIVGVVGAYLSGVFVYTGIFPCLVPPGWTADGMATAKALTWNDLNGNGVVDSGEPPLSWVTVDFVFGYPPSITGANGEGSVGKFKPGCACNCWKGESIKVVIPVGYQATTPTQADLTREDEIHTFGFQLQDSTQRISFPNEPDWFQAFTNRGLTLTAFHYSDSDKQLAISLKNNLDQDDEEMYRDVFNIISALSYSDIAVQRLSIATTSSKDVATCDLDAVRKWAGKISYEEILASYCQHTRP